jgi:hypothetical protein
MERRRATVRRALSRRELQIDPTREKGSWIIQKGRKSSE